ncbi:MAG: acetate kinase [Oscillospiraceae bacterium]|nr:acetate kinase [Oscillospiraceae bacterium]
MPEGVVLSKGLCERIGIPGGRNVHTDRYGAKHEFQVEMASHTDAIKILTERLTDPEFGVISSMKDIDAVGHRVLHGGPGFTESCLVTPEVKKAIREVIPLGPLHNPANLMGIEACEAVMGSVPQVVVFDTAFGTATMPPKAYTYAIPKELAEKHHIRRYGFHGTSHRFVSARAAEMLGRPAEGLRIVTCHLGNGSSCSAVKDGKCVDTSMGLTPLEGLVMGTRSGSLDPAIIGFLAEHEGMTAAEVVTMLNKKSGLLGITGGLSSDCRDLMAARADGNPDAALAIDMLAYSVKKYIGAFAAAMGGLDAVVFTGGIGENNEVIRNLIAGDLEFMGVKLDPVKKLKHEKNCDIAAADSPVRVLVIETNEELVIARDTLALVGLA